MTSLDEPRLTTERTLMTRTVSRRTLIDRFRVEEGLLFLVRGCRGASKEDHPVRAVFGASGRMLAGNGGVGGGSS